MEKKKASRAMEACAICVSAIAVVGSVAWIVIRAPTTSTNGARHQVAGETAFQCKIQGEAWFVRKGGESQVIRGMDVVITRWSFAGPQSDAVLNRTARIMDRLALSGAELAEWSGQLASRDEASAAQYAKSAKENSKSYEEAYIRGSDLASFYKQKMESDEEFARLYQDQASNSKSFSASSQGVATKYGLAHSEWIGRADATPRFTLNDLGRAIGEIRISIRGLEGLSESFEKLRAQGAAKDAPTLPDPKFIGKEMHAVEQFIDAEAFAKGRTNIQGQLDLDVSLLEGQYAAWAIYEVESFVIVWALPFEISAAQPVVALEFSNDSACFLKNN